MAYGIYFLHNRSCIWPGIDGVDIAFPRECVSDKIQRLLGRADIEFYVVHTR